MHVYGTDISEPVATFEQLQKEYNVDTRILANLQSLGFHTPTAVEMQAIPIMLQVCTATCVKYLLYTVCHIILQINELHIDGIMLLKDRGVTNYWTPCICIVYSHPVE